MNMEKVYQMKISKVYPLLLNKAVKKGRTKDEVDEIICRAVNYDVMCGVARRAWAGNPHALETVSLYQEPGNTLTLPFSCDDQELSEMINGLSK